MDCSSQNIGTSSPQHDSPLGRKWDTGPRYGLNAVEEVEISIIRSICAGFENAGEWWKDDTDNLLSRLSYTCVANGRTLARATRLRMSDRRTDILLAI
jgi:hypothetical protein